jgi:hypothetical protein
MQNKRDIFCQISIEVLDRNRPVIPLVQAVTQMKYYQRTVWQVSEFCSSATFFL